MPKNNKPIGSNLAKLVMRPVTDEDLQEVPLLTDEDFARGIIMKGGKALRGRPKLDAPKKQVTLRLDADLVKHMQASGPGWHTRANAMLRKANGLT